MKQKLLAWLLLATASAFAQFTPSIQNKNLWGGSDGVASGTALIYPDPKGTITENWELKASGTAAGGLTLTVVGCMGDPNDAICSSTIVSNSGVASQLMTPSSYNLYDYYKATLSWTGGDATTKFILRQIGTVARLPSSGGAGTSLTVGNLQFNASAPSPSGSSSCPSATTPVWWIKDANGNWQSQAGVDPNSNNISPGGTLEFCRRTWFTDLQVSPPYGNNAFVSIDHLSGTGTAITNQDRSLWVNLQTPTNDAGTHYGLEGIQSEVDFNCNGCTINGSPDGEVSSGSFQMSQNAATNYSSNADGTSAIRAELFHSNTGEDGNGNNAINAIFDNNTASTGSVFTASVLNANCENSAGGTIANLECDGMEFSGPGFNAFGNGVVALHIKFYGGFTTIGANDYLIKNDVAGLPSNFNGPISASNVIASGIVDGKAPVTITTGSTATLGGTYLSGYTFNQEGTAATAVTYTLPTAAAGLQYCVKNSNNGSAANTGALTLQTSAAGQSIIYNGTAGASDGFLISGGAAGDAACVVGISATQWEAYAQVGTWTVH